MKYKNFTKNLQNTYESLFTDEEAVSRVAQRI
jgi:hypothetical protein